MSSLLLSTATPNFGELFTNGRTFVVPRFQRDYKWTQDNWEDLWQDLLNVVESNRQHYMGAIVLKPNDDNPKQFEVIDGQQRLATLVLLVLAGIKTFETWAANRLDPAANQERADSYRNQFLRIKDRASLKETGRLKLNRNDDSFMHSTLLQLRSPTRVSSLPISHKRLWNGFEFFLTRITERYGVSNDAVGLTKLLDTAGDKLLFIQILVSDELDAYTVFETLNGRGTQLTVTDLLKNFLFSKFGLDENAIDVAEEQWLRIANQNDDQNFSRFISYYWNSKHGVTSPSRLFKEIRNGITTADESSAFLDDCEKMAVINAALKDSTDEIWQPINKARDYVREINLFRATQCYPLLFAAWDHMQSDFAAVLKICSVITLRYIVIGGMSTNTMQGQYVKAALQIRNGSIKSPKELLKALASIYPSDAQFKADFSNAVLPTTQKSLVRYILFKLENNYSGNERAFDSDGGTIEHILPENPDNYWHELFPDAATDCYRLGNYTLLEAPKNRQIARSAYDEKKEMYSQSAYELSKRITWQEWNKESLFNRQEVLAKQAVHIWKLDY